MTLMNSSMKREQMRFYSNSRNGKTRRLEVQRRLRRVIQTSTRSSVLQTDILATFQWTTKGMKSLSLTQRNWRTFLELALIKQLFKRRWTSFSQKLCKAEAKPTCSWVVVLSRAHSVAISQELLSSSTGLLTRRSIMLKVACRQLRKWEETVLSTTFQMRVMTI